MELKEIRIRLPEKQYKEIKDYSAKEGRSMNKQIIQIIKETVADKSNK